MGETETTRAVGEAVQHGLQRTLGAHALRRLQVYGAGVDAGVARRQHAAVLVGVVRHVGESQRCGAVAAVQHQT